MILDAGGMRRARGLVAVLVGAVGLGAGAGYALTAPRARAERPTAAPRPAPGSGAETPAGHRGPGLRAARPSPAPLVRGAEPAAPPSTAARPFVVVLDPGHGGSNTGAAGVVDGLNEKRLTLALARATARRLAREPGVVVSLTRARDRYLSLAERVRRAHAAGADVFLSIHANASPSRGHRGFETWVLTPWALEIDARALRRGDGPVRAGVDPETAALLDDLERGAAAPWSVRLAGRLQARLAEARPDAVDRGVRQGSMDVLLGATMPAALVEVGFFDHPEEGADLLRRGTRARVADALATAILDLRTATAAQR